MVAQAILLALLGLPGIYFHSLFGSRGWLEGAQLTGHNRSINRQKLSRVELEHELSDIGSLRYQVFNRYRNLLNARASSPAFHPYGAQQVRYCGDFVFALLRSSAGEEEQVLCLHNVSAKPQIVDLSDIGPSLADLLSQQKWQDALSIELAPYQVRWLHLEGHHGSHT
jgi:sucrose phosphorylase